MIKINVSNDGSMKWIVFAGGNGIWLELKGILTDHYSTLSKWAKFISWARMTIAYLELMWSLYQLVGSCR